MSIWRAKSAAILACLAACSDGATQPPARDSLSPNARPEVLASLRADLSTARHAGDGGGRAWIEAGPGEVVAGSAASFTFVYEAGPLGVDEDGMVMLQVSPFWGWSTPQVSEPEAPGYTRVTTRADGVDLESGTLGPQLLGIHVGGRGLEAGERIEILYGAGPLGATVDRFAERRSRFWFSVDADGDGVRGLLAESPTVDVLAARPTQLHLALPATAVAGETVTLRAALLDALGNVSSLSALGHANDAGTMAVTLPPGLEGEERIALDERGIAAVPLRIREDLASGAVLRVASELPFVSVSNPLVIRAPGSRRLLWADLHGHSGFSDGTGLPEDFFRYARDVAGLDVVALTDHDHWGMQPLSTTPELWQEIESETAKFHAPGQFVTVLGYEWTNWLHGHRHVLYFGDQGRVLSSVDPAWETPAQLWQGLANEPALTFAHHSAGGPIATNWDFAPPPELEPVTEIVSVHGSSEAADTARPIYDFQPGNTVRDALARGYRLGFIGSGDSHDGHPGLAQLASPSSGLAAIWSSELSRDGVLEALKARRTYATNGHRIYLDAELAGYELGATVPPLRHAELRVRAVASLPIVRVDVVSDGTVSSEPVDGVLELEMMRTIPRLDAGSYLYVRVLLEDDSAAWSSPFFAR